MLCRLGQLEAPRNDVGAFFLVTAAATSTVMDKIHKRKARILISQLAHYPYAFLIQITYRVCLDMSNQGTYCLSLHHTALYNFLHTLQSVM